MKKLMMLIFTMLLLSANGRAHAYLHVWADIPTVADGVDSNLSGGQDIVAAWYATDDSFHYFRMDLRTAPSFSENNTPNFAGLYGIYIDKQAGGAVGSDPLQTYVPDSLTGIDNIIDSHFEPNFGGFFQHDFHTWTDSQTFQRSIPFAFSQNENGGVTLEWAISVSQLGADSFTWWAVTHDIGVSSPTYDQTTAQSVNPIPLPSAVWLLASGLIFPARMSRRLGLK